MFLQNLRRQASWLIVLTVMSGGTVTAQLEKREITFESVSDAAASLINEAPRPRVEEISKQLKELNYDDYRNIRFRPSEALWWNAPSNFRVEFFHLGHIFQDPVEVFEYTSSHVQKIPFRGDSYNYEQSSYKPGFFNAPNNHAGIRIKSPLNREDVFDDLLVFLGASYFRALGPGQAYGLSLRGLAMNTLGDREDFPRFTKLWLRKPQKGDQTLRVLALLEGEKVTGAYQFDVHYNGITEIEVRCQLYFREGGAQQVGIAPITSMFVFGENSSHKYGDWRPEVHDSDGVLIQSSGGWLWHPLDNIPGRYIKQFEVQSLDGFGLMQRDRNFSNYKDLEAQYQKRPSAWITPIGEWPKGQVVLYSFETNSEATDNINLFWKPENSEDAEAKSLELRYKINLQLKSPNHDLAQVLESRVGHRTLDPKSRTFLIEFSRPERITLEEIAQLKIKFVANDLELIEAPVIQYNSAEDRIRVFANVHAPDPERNHENFELSTQLFQADKAISEKWSYTWNP